MRGSGPGNGPPACGWGIRAKTVIAIPRLSSRLHRLGLGGSARQFRWAELCRPHIDNMLVSQPAAGHLISV